MKLVKNENNKNTEIVTDEEAREAFVKILKWIGEDPSREGLLETPKRVTKAFKEYFKGYKEDPKEILSKTFGDVEGYSDMVVQKLFLYKVTANIIWHLLLESHMLLIFQMRELLDSAKLQELWKFFQKGFKHRKD